MSAKKPRADQSPPVGETIQSFAPEVQAAEKTKAAKDRTQGLAEQEAQIAKDAINRIVFPEGEMSEPEAAAIIESPQVFKSQYPLSPYNDTGRKRVSTSLILSTPAAKSAAFRAAAGQDYRAEDVLGQVFSVTNWLCHDAERVNDDGEEQKWIRTVLLTEDGKRISCGSIGVVMSLMSLMAHEWFGPAPWNPPLLISIEPERSRKGRTFYQLIPHDT